MMPERFELTYAERVGPLWTRFTEHLTNQLDQARKMNDSAGNTEQATAALRGRIACLKGLVALGNERPMTAVDRDEEFLPVAIYDERMRK